MADDFTSQSSSGQRAERYSQHANSAFEGRLALRTAANEGAFFLRFLHPGMRVLDVGCGPGSITLGIAKTVAPGETVGIDFQPSQVAQGVALAAAHGQQNVCFEVADVYQLPFPDGSFDAAFANTVLMHLKQPLRALAEMRRVLRPGGIVGIRDCDWGGRIHVPATSLLEQWYSITVRVRQHNGGDPYMGRHHRRLLLDAGFVRAEASVSVATAGTPEETRHHANFLKAQLQGLGSTALAEGWIDQATIEAVSAEIEAWSVRPDALYVDMFCEAIGWVSE